MRNYDLADVLYQPDTLETPQASLVIGMKWLPGGYTKRFNIRRDDTCVNLHFLRDSLLFRSYEEIDLRSAFCHKLACLARGHPYRNFRLQTGGCDA